MNQQANTATSVNASSPAILAQEWKVISQPSTIRGKNQAARLRAVSVRAFAS
jgi:hypothetical protein